MCDFNKGFILCKCNDPKVIVHNKKSRLNKDKKNKQIENRRDKICFMIVTFL